MYTLINSNHVYDINKQYAFVAKVETKLVSTSTYGSWETMENKELQS